jgi:large subunit ribosomal protein L25
MEWVTVKASIREKIGTSNCRRLRKTGVVPAVLYGRKEAVQMLNIERKDAAKMLAHHTHLLNLAMPTATEKVVVKEIKYDGLREEVMHIDFVRIAMDEQLNISVDIILKGHPKGILEGGVMEQNLRALNINCLPTAIPEKIEVDVSGMEIGALIRVKDIKLPSGVTAATDAEVVVVGVHKPREEVVAATPLEGAPTQPELIVKKKEVEDEEADAKSGDKKAAAPAAAPQPGAKPAKEEKKK